MNHNIYPAFCARRLCDPHRQEPKHVDLDLSNPMVESTHSHERTTSLHLYVTLRGLIAYWHCIVIQHRGEMRCIIRSYVAK
jgi:hypothetical protein